MSPDDENVIAKPTARHGIEPADFRRSASSAVGHRTSRVTTRSFANAKFACNAAFSALLVAVPMAASAQMNPGPAEDATAAAHYKVLHLSRDPMVVAAGDYRLDPHHTSITATLAHMGLSRYTLRFDAVSSRFAFNPDHATASRIEISVDPTSVDTGDQAFDKKFAADYFEAGKYAAIAFKATAVKIVSNHFLIDGILDFHGVTKPVALHVTYYGFAQSRIGFSGTATFKRSEFGVGERDLLEADEVAILVEAEFVKTGKERRPQSRHTTRAARRADCASRAKRPTPGVRKTLRLPTS